MLGLYNTALMPLRLGLALWARLPRSGASRLEWAQRRGRELPEVEAGSLWLHGASVGEARIVSALATGLRRMRPELPLCASALTPGGRSQLPGSPVVDAAFYLPLDFRSIVDRGLRHLSPSLLALVETELWPNLLHRCQARGVPTVMLNARLSARRMGRYRRLGALYRPLLGGMSRIGARSELDAERLVALGAAPDRLEVTGNLKYDLPRPEVTREEIRRRNAIAADRPVFVAGSTAPEEDALVLDAFTELRRDRAELLLILAPRHLDRIDALSREISARGLSLRRISQPSAEAAPCEVLLVDEFGSLNDLYVAADVAFVGGSLVPIGGHNMLEPAAASRPVLFGRHTENFREPAQALIDAGGALRLEDAAGLAPTLGALLADPDRREEIGRAAYELVDSHRGALERSLRILLEAGSKEDRS